MSVGILPNGTWVFLNQSFRDFSIKPCTGEEGIEKEVNKPKANVCFIISTLSFWIFLLLLSKTGLGEK